MTSPHRFAALCALALAPFAAGAFSEADLLPVDKAFQLEVQAPRRDAIELDWKIAPGYYLYRHRISVKAEPGFEAGALTLPAGRKKHDEFFGDVETYHDEVRAVQAGTAADGVDAVTLEVRYQGCADAGVCYPPQRRVLKVALPAAAGAAAVPNPLAAPAPSRLFGGGAPGMDALPLPAEQAFRFEAIVGDGNTLLLRFTPTPGYYLYRDRTSLALEGAAGIRTGMPQWPAGKFHRDEHFGNVTVYFDQAEVTLPLLRDRPDPANATLVATFQGCQTDGICYPPMTRRVKLALPAGKVSPANQAAAAALLIPPLSGERATDALAL
ncbi:MAG TPA: cytochrome C biogenesis protein, partial [Xanthomonadaceae bacterium]|nr:cytochrome C biogenesis protein [Xanthomonadaceae bacterium]